MNSSAVVCLLLAVSVASVLGKPVVNKAKNAAQLEKIKVNTNANLDIVSGEFLRKALKDLKLPEGEEETTAPNVEAVEKRSVENEAVEEPPTVPESVEKDAASAEAAEKPANSAQAVEKREASAETDEKDDASAETVKKDKILVDAEPAEKPANSPEVVEKRDVSEDAKIVAAEITAEVMKQIKAQALAFAEADHANRV